jgi:hypothetical protein
VTKATIVLDISVDELLGFLNRTLNAAKENDFWIGDPFTETNCNAPSRYSNVHDFATALDLQRQHARLMLQTAIDKWIDSGRKEDASENAMLRTEERSPEAALGAALFWRFSRFERTQTAAGFAVRPVPPGDTYDDAEWKARRCIAGVLDSPELRYRIAKCRFAGCKRPYFLLKNPEKKTYKHGIFCCPKHNKKAISARYSETYRRKRNLARIREAAQFLAKRKFPIWNDDLKNKIARHLDDGSRVNWVTRHQDEIQTAARGLRVR